ncbi:hypothetical protein ACIBCM_12275 [Streptomyces sp. NPDC051018]|uniref:hypothetical protein n=1 Tax=Streptomyces sp. NPDC051018 TaxID=3365639 RepID=UPI0037AF16D8
MVLRRELICRPRITRRALCDDALSAVAQGVSDPTEVGSMPERARSAMVAH